MTVNTHDGNLGPVVTFYNSSSADLGSIMLTMSGITVTIRNSSASFSFPREQGSDDHIRLQLCMDGNRVEFYYECGFVGDEAFANEGFQNSDSIGLLIHLANNNYEVYTVYVMYARV